MRKVIIMKKDPLDENMKVATFSDENIRYYKVDDSDNFVLEGAPFREKGGSFRRLPEKTELFPYSEMVDLLANHSAGISLRFSSDTSDIRVRAKVRKYHHTGDIMSYGRAGFDLYCGEPQKSFCAGVTILNFDELEHPECMVNTRIFNRPNPSKKINEFQINFPLYAEVLEFEVGLEKDAKILAPSPRKNPRPIIIYGTSIEQGCCASRPGMAYSNQLSRRLNREVINLGFAGNGKGEEFMARLLADIPNPGAYVLWYDSNVSPDELETTLPKFTDILRNRHRYIPIVTISRLQYPEETPVNGISQEIIISRERRTSIHSENLHRRIKLGDSRIHFIDGRKILDGNPEECYVDLIHPNDLGMTKITDALAPRLAIIAE